MNGCSIPAYPVPPVYLDCCKKASVPSVAEQYQMAKQEQEKKDKTMRNDVNLNVMTQTTRTRDLAAEAKDHLIDRSYRIFTEKTDELRKRFFIDEPRGPKTVGELRKALTEGKFTFSDRGLKDEQEIYWDSVDGYISWRTPETQKDEEGYDKARKALKALRTRIEDQIIVGDAATGLKAIQEFENTDSATL